nr:hypothetical protein CFP56_50387 [Quercus suber]
MATRCRPARLSRPPAEMQVANKDVPKLSEPRGITTSSNAASWRRRLFRQGTAADGPVELRTTELSSDPCDIPLYINSTETERRESCILPTA